MTAQTGARCAYAANILILVPVLVMLFTEHGEGGLRTFEGTISNVDGLRLLVGSLWLGILVLSAAGLRRPCVFLPVLALQVIYKATYLAVYVIPRWWADGAAAVPWGVTVSFAAIVTVWPVVLYANRQHFARGSV